MISTLISYNGEYCEYHSSEKKERRLAIDGYESDFLSDLVASYLFEKSKPLLNPKTYHDIFQDYGLVLFKGKKSKQEIKNCSE